MLDQEIDHFHAPKIRVEILLAFRLEQFAQERRAVDSPLGNCFQELRRGLRDPAIAKERLAESRISARAFYRLLLFGPDQSHNFIPQLRSVGRPDRHGIADFVSQTPAREIQLEMARILFRAFAAQTAVYRQFRGKWIRSRVRAWHCGSGALQAPENFRSITRKSAVIDATKTSRRCRWRVWDKPPSRAAPRPFLRHSPAA